MSNEHVPVSLQRRVRLRAGDRCEYCRLSQVSQEATFHVDHVVPRNAGGTSAMENLAGVRVLLAAESSADHRDRSRDR